MSYLIQHGNEIYHSRRWAEEGRNTNWSYQNSTTWVQREQVQTAILLELTAPVGELHGNVMPYLPREKWQVNIEHLVEQIQRGQSLRSKGKYSPVKAAQRHAQGLGRKKRRSGVDLMLAENSRRTIQSQRSQIFDRPHQNENIPDQSTIGSSVALHRSPLESRAYFEFVRWYAAARHLEVEDSKSDTLINFNSSISP